MIDKNNVPYYQVAKQALMNWNGLTEEQADKLIAESSFEEIESQVYAQGSMTYAITSIGKNLGLTDEELKEFEDEVFGRTDNQEVMSTNLYKKLQAFTSNKEKNMSVFLSATDHNMATLIVDAMETVHDGWVEDNAKHFFTKKADRKQQYQFLPLELIGWDEAKSDLLFIKPIIEYIGGYVSEEKIKEECNDRTIAFFQNHSGWVHGGTLEMSIHNMADLGNWMTENGLEYEHWTPEIDAAMSDSKFVHETLLPQVREKGFVKDTELMYKLEDAQLFKVDGPSKDEIIASVQAKREIIGHQQEEIKTLQQEKNNQMSKDSQQH